MSALGHKQTSPYQDRKVRLPLQSGHWAHFNNEVPIVSGFPTLLVRVRKPSRVGVSLNSDPTKTAFNQQLNNGYIEGDRVIGVRSHAYKTQFLLR